MTVDLPKRQVENRARVVQQAHNKKAMDKVLKMTCLTSCRATPAPAAKAALVEVAVPATKGTLVLLASVGPVGVPGVTGPPITGCRIRPGNSRHSKAAKLLHIRQGRGVIGIGTGAAI